MPKKINYIYIKFTFCNLLKLHKIFLKLCILEKFLEKIIEITKNASIGGPMDGQNENEIIFTQPHQHKYILVRHRNTQVAQ